MKTLLFGLATTAAACASTSQPQQYPLCDREGAPACGNIGQVGRAERPATLQITRDANVVFARNQTATRAVQHVAEAATTVIPTLTRVLVGASRELTTVAPFAGPRMDHREQIACGNVMSKGGSRRVCRDPNGNGVDPTLAHTLGHVVEVDEEGH